MSYLINYAYDGKGCREDLSQWAVTESVDLEIFKTDLG